MVSKANTEPKHTTVNIKSVDGKNTKREESLLNTLYMDNIYSKFAIKPHLFHLKPREIKVN